ncbi:MAG: TrmB family transcriptional regulator [Candidatus Woesearchaeota archaeon]
MKPEDFLQLGLNINEAKVYYTLVLTGPTTASTIIKKLGFHRNIVYDNLEKLTNKGIVSYINTRGKRIYSPQNPHTIIDFLEKEKKEAQEKINYAQNLIPSITKNLATLEKPTNVQFFQGIAGLKQVLKMTLDTNDKNQYVIGISNESVEVMGETYWDNYNRKILDRELNQHILMNKEYQEVTILSRIGDKKIRILPKELSQVVQYMIFENKVAILVFSKIPIAILIENKEIYESYKAQFKQYWKVSKQVK